jgi:tripartite-type tricarboxylate transporter receptor subunit TctC
VKQKSESIGGYIHTSTPEEMTAFMRKEAARWGTALKELGIHYD